MLALIPLIILGAIVAGIVALVRRRSDDSEPGAARTIVVAALGFITLVVGAVGVARLAALTFTGLPVLVGTGASTEQIAIALALTVVGVPAFAGLWRQMLDDADGGHTTGLSLHMAAVTLVFGIGSLISLANTLQWLFGERGIGAFVGFAIVWPAVWVWHEVVRARYSTETEEIDSLAPTAGSVIGYLVVIVAGIAFLGQIFETIYDALVSPGLASNRDLGDVVDAGTWLAVGGSIYLWQWIGLLRHRPASTLRSLFTVGSTTVAGTTAVSAIAGLLFMTVMFPFEDESAAAWFEEAPIIVAAVLVAGMLWRHHNRVVAVEGGTPEIATTHVLAGVGLIGAASGLGVIVNSILGSLVPVVAESRTTELFFGGLSALVVYGVLWWAMWKPMDRPSAEERMSPVRRFYLTALAGIGSIVALITLVTLAYRLFEALLDGSTFSAVVDATRAPLGVMVATGLVAFYHGRLWLADRKMRPTAEVAATKIRRVTVVAADAGDISKRLRSDLEVPVLALTHAGDGRVVSADDLADTVRDLEAGEVVIVGEGDGYRVLRLQP